MFSTMLSLLGSLRRGNFVTNSLRFRSSASANLTRTPSVDGTTRGTWTFSCWLKRGTIGALQTIFIARDFANSTNVFPYGVIGFTATDALQYQESYNGGEVGNRITSQVFRDPSAWYHIVVALNTTLSTESDRVKLYVNGNQITDFSSSEGPSGYSSIITSNKLHRLGGSIAATTAAVTSAFDGYLTEVYLIDGQALTPSSFGQIESTSGVWSPKQYVGTYGTNGFYLKFGNATSLSALGTDSSGNGNTWAVNNVSLVAGVGYDSMLDVPVNYNDDGNGRGNYSVLNPLASGASGTSGFPEANLCISGTGTIRGVGTIQLPTSGKWYFEVSGVGYGTGGAAYVGVGSTASQLSTAYCIYSTDGTRNITGSPASYGLPWGAPSTNSDVIGVAVDQALATITFYKNNVSQGAITHGIGATLYSIIGKTGPNAGIMRVNFGQRPFSYTPPAGFRALNTNNLPTP